MTSTPTRREFCGKAALGLVAASLQAADSPRRSLAPSALAAGADRTVYLADRRRSIILRRDPDGTLSTVFEGSEKSRTPLRAIMALALDKDGVLFAADSATSEVYRVRPGGAPVPLSGGAFEIPTGLAITPAGDLLVTDLRLGIVARLARGGGSPATLARIPAPRGVALSPSGGLVVLSMGPDQVLQVTPDGRVRPLVKGKPFRFPIAIQGDPSTPYVASDGDAATLWAISEGGEVRPLTRGLPLVRPEGLARDATGALLVADPSAGQVFRVSPGRVEALLTTP